MISLNRTVFGFRINFSISFCSDFNLEATVVKADGIRGVKQLFTPCFLLTRKQIFSKIIINNYRILHQKNYVNNNNDQTFNKQRPNNKVWKFPVAFCESNVWKFGMSFGTLAHKVKKLACDLACWHAIWHAFSTLTGMLARVNHSGM